MIFIDLLNNPPSEELIKEGENLTEQLKELPPGKRESFIDSHANYWKKLKDYYEKLSYGKCWYTEAKEKSSYYHMDHFRPKKTPKELTKINIKTSNSKEAYWWLAFDWKNYRLSASIPNCNKLGYFPLKYGTNAIKEGENLQNELCGLIDPVDDYDVSLIAFGLDGNICPACDDGTCWEAERVYISIEVYDLNNIKLVESRKQIQNTCKIKIDLIKELRHEYIKNNSASGREILKKYIRELRNMVKPTAEFSAVARNYIRNQKEEFIKNLVF